MIAGHRWEYQVDYRGYKCVGLPFGGVESHQWCVGCGCVIPDRLLCECIGDVAGLSLLPFLDMLAIGGGYEPIEADTYEEWKFNN